MQTKRHASYHLRLSLFISMHLFHGSTGLHNDILRRILHEQRAIGERGAASEVSADISNTHMTAFLHGTKGPKRTITIYHWVMYVAKAQLHTQCLCSLRVTARKPPPTASPDHARLNPSCAAMHGHSFRIALLLRLYSHTRRA